MKRWNIPGVTYPEPRDPALDKKLAYDRERRRKFIAAGLNWEGKPRQRKLYRRTKP
jgi:hypothetical protein